MHQILNINQKVRTETSGIKCEIDQFIGGGGQGEVYRAKLNGKTIAVKWYFKSAATQEQRSRLEELIRQGPPNEQFLWPLEMVSSDEIPGYGYLMPLRESNYRSIVDLMRRRIKPEPTFRSLAIAGLNLAHGFLQLHAKGLCYRDISFGNVFFDPSDGKILICDNDNVDINGQPGPISGTPRFMAPEIVIGEAMPTTQTDLYSLSVLLFYILIMHHPLEGKKDAAIHCLDLPTMTKLYGTEPVFIYDPSDETNRPVPGYHDNAIVFWPLYPQFLRDLFTKAFTNGISDPVNGRVRETEWRSAMVKLADSIFYCGYCGSENFYDLKIMQESEGKLGKCWSCKKNLRLPPRMKIERSIVMLNHDTKIYPHHVDNQRRYDFSEPVGIVTQHPENPKIWGIKNLSSEKWVSTMDDGVIKDVKSGSSVRMTAGLKINFGMKEGEIRV